MSSCVCKILFKSEQICGCCCKMLRGSLFGDTRYCPVGPQLQPAAAACSGRLMGQTDGQTPYRYRDLAAYYTTCVNKVENIDRTR